MVAGARQAFSLLNKVFAGHPFSSATKWNSPIRALITHPLLVAMESCNSMVQLKQIQGCMTRAGLVSDVFPASRVLAFCALSDAGDMVYGRLFFDHFLNPNTYMWNTIIRGYTKAGMAVDGISTFGRMIEMTVEIDSRTFVFVLKACERIRGIDEGESVHCMIWKTGYEVDELVGNGLVHFYGEVGCLAKARKVFDNMPVKDIVSWTSMIDGYAVSGFCDEALLLYDTLLLSDTRPNDVTLIAVLSACSKKKDLEMGKKVHAYIINTRRSCGINLSNAVLDLYMKFGCVTLAQNLFEEMVVKDVFTWTIMVNGFAKSGDLHNARLLFDEMPERNFVSWNALIAGYSQNSKPKETLELFVEMIDSGLVPNENTLVCVLSSCGQLGCQGFGQWIHSKYFLEQNLGCSVIMGNALLEMYAKGGLIDEAANIFSNMPRRNLASWNSMITAYAAHGNASKALSVFDQMLSEGVNPDDITMVGVLSACSHGGMVTEGREYFQRMKIDYNVEPKEEHFACMIDLLGRVGLVEDAYALISEMEMKAQKSAWGALLNACRIHGNAELAEIAAEKLMNMDPGDAGNYVLLASTYANAKRWNEVGNIRRMMREKGVKKLPGQSLIEVDGEFHCFLSRDFANPRFHRVYRLLEAIYAVAKVDPNQIFNSEPL